ncbi:polysaccharide biosynthesis/export family protein [Pseudoalteromonas sp.]|uniref:polysaccharide biosynthesis/export family protein n=1 Tax=Pseudoalteromonas sp. TaxID=53249 RepID=UPI003561E493
MLRLVCLALFFVLPSIAAQDNYILGPGDKISIKVYGQEDLTVESFLGNSGEINYPFLGEIKIAGLTVKQIEHLVTKGLKEGYLIKPNVFAQVIEYRPFYIHGEVKNPGAYPYNPGMSINQAIALAGGLTERASEDKVFLFKEGNNTNQLKATLDTKVSAGDTIKIDQRFF